MLCKYSLFIVLFCIAASAGYAQAGSGSQKDSSIKNAAATASTTIRQYNNRLSQQTDSIAQALQKIPAKYIASIDKKIDKYSNRITSKTEKTLTKLAKWESKIKVMLDKVSPETSQRLYGNNQPTFASLLQKIQEGKSISKQYHAQYDAYRDKLTTSIQYLQAQKDKLGQKLLQPLDTVNKKMQQLNKEEDESAAIQQFIKERKKQLISGAMHYIGKSNYLSKIDKESWYYAETLKNYKEIFNDEAKLEQTIKTVLNKIPAFTNFVKQNSMLASLFGSSTGQIPPLGGGGALAGLQTRAGVQSLIQERIASGGPNAQEMVTQNIQSAQAQLTQLKDKLLKAPTGGGEAWDNSSSLGGSRKGAPNMQKTKTLKQRLEYGSTLQFGKSNSLMPTTMDVALTVGYKLNDKSVAGIGAGYKMGLGSIDRIRFSNQGLNLRSFMDWKLKRQFFVSGGYEMNYLSNLPVPLNNSPSGDGGWQQSALAGVSKKIKVKTKWFKETKVQLLYDFLAKQHLPVSQPILFRVGYGF